MYEKKVIRVKMLAVVIFFLGVVGMNFELKQLYTGGPGSWMLLVIGPLMMACGLWLFFKVRP